MNLNIIISIIGLNKILKIKLTFLHPQVTQNLTCSGSDEK